MKWIDESADVIGVDKVIDRLSGQIKGGDIKGAKGFEYVFEASSNLRKQGYEITEFELNNIDIIFKDSAGKVFAAEIKSGSLPGNINDQLKRIIDYAESLKAQGKEAEPLLISK